MRQSEILFVQMWRDNATEGYLSADAANNATQRCPGRRDAILGGPADPDCPGLIESENIPGGWRWRLNPRGADLVASYEAALAQGLEIVADDGRRPWETPKPRTEVVVPCSKCKGSGKVEIPIERGAMGGIVRWWPATCPRCNGKRGTVAVSLGVTGDGPAQIERAIKSMARMDRKADERYEWMQLTRAVGERLVGQRFQARRHPRGLIHHVTARRVTASALWLETYSDDGLPFNGLWWVRRLPESHTSWKPLRPDDAHELLGRRIELRAPGGWMFRPSAVTVCDSVNNSASNVVVTVTLSAPDGKRLSPGHADILADGQWSVREVISTEAQR